MESINIDNLKEFTHLITSLIFIKFLKDKNPYLLTFLLISITSYILYDIQKYDFLIFGLIIYVLEKIFIENKKDNDIDNDKNKIIIKQTDFWKIFYYSILSYYIMKYSNRSME